MKFLFLLLITIFFLNHIPKSFCNTRGQYSGLLGPRSSPLPLCRVNHYGDCVKNPGTAPAPSPPPPPPPPPSPPPPPPPSPPPPAPPLKPHRINKPTVNESNSSPTPATARFGTRTRTNKTGRPLMIGIGVGTAAALMMIGVMIYCRKTILINKWKSADGNNQLVEEFMSTYGSTAPKEYTYSQVRKMTNSFSDKLGHGGFGCVYRGKLSDGRQVAVKVLKDSGGNGEDFINEVAAISRTSHVNVVALLGFSYNKKRALIYEFMPNGSLDKFIGQKGSEHLEWSLLYRIIVGIARGLEYLHRGCSTRIVHLDIKPQNILLDVDFCPKISDFGLAKLFKKKQSILSTMGTRGTIGYIAPEVFCRNFGGISHKSDVYSYGMMVLEMVGLRSKVVIDSQQESENYFPNWIYEHVELGRELPLEGVTNEEEKETVMKMIVVGLWCIQTNPWDRPSISKVVEMLDGNLVSLQMPPKPFLDSPKAENSDPKSWTTSSISCS